MIYNLYKYQIESNYEINLRVNFFFALGQISNKKKAQPFIKIKYSNNKNKTPTRYYIPNLLKRNQLEINTENRIF